MWHLVDLEVVGAALVFGSVVFTLGHAAGYWRAKDVARRRSLLALERARHAEVAPQPIPVTSPREAKS